MSNSEPHNRYQRSSHIANDLDSILARWRERITPEREAQIQAENEKARKKAENECRQAYWAKLESWGIPRKDIARISADRFDATVAMRQVERFARNLAAEPSLERMERPCTVLVLAGPPGCGKTTAAARWLADACGHKARQVAHSKATEIPAFMPVSQLIRVSRFDNASMVALEKAARLVIDDLGAEYLDNKGAFLSFVDGLLNARYADWRPTVITTNLSAAQFSERYGTRTIDRLREVGRFVEIDSDTLRTVAS